MRNPVAHLAAALADRYRLERELGQGGMATVWLAEDLKHGREVAIKVLRPELAAALGTERFLAEIRTTARLQHLHILPLLDSGEAGGALYYVMPFVAGETLRARLTHEPQLPVEDALRIAREVADALGHAHDAGVIHRDIKPENVLLQGGHAIVADFGIALAVKEAGGHRLTETGLSLGTPQYMSPEQATGDRQLDARSDVYSLGAVLYEMLAGEPPVTGPTAQAIIAKLMTESPVHLRVVRPSVPEAVDAAVARALDKTPADRFASVREFARALEPRTASSAAHDVATVPLATADSTRSRGRLVVGGLLAALLLAAAAGAYARRKPTAPSPPALSLRDRTQLTFTGNVFASAISPDGTQLASIARDCGDSGCRYAVDVQDVGGTVTHRLLDGASAAYGVWWSPDRRNLIFCGTVDTRWGFYLLSALGGPARFLAFPTAFYGSDSLLITPPYSHVDSVFDVKVSSLDGTVRDSIRVASAVGPGRLAWLMVSPAGKWIAGLILHDGHFYAHVFDRSGKVVSHGTAMDAFYGMPAIIAGDALWFPRWSEGTGSILRVAVDPATGRLADRTDTLLPGKFESFSVTADGRTLVVDAGTAEYAAWAGQAADMFRGRFVGAPLLRSSDKFDAALSPDGARVLLRRRLPTPAGRPEPRYSIIPFAGGSERALETDGKPNVVQWVDSTRVVTFGQGAAGQRAALLDVRSGSTERVLDLQDSLASAQVTSLAVLPDGWAWLDEGGNQIHVRRNGTTRDIAAPRWFVNLNEVHADAAGGRLVVIGWNASTYDTIGVAVVPVDGGTPELWARWHAEGGDARFLPDGSVLATRWDTRESAEFYRVSGPNVVRRIGREPRAASNVTLSDNLARAAVVEVIRHGDAFMSRLAGR